jgi:hypothetical protein
MVRSSPINRASLNVPGKATVGKKGRFATCVVVAPITWFTAAPPGIKAILLQGSGTIFQLGNGTQVIAEDVVKPDRKTNYCSYSFAPLGLGLLLFLLPRALPCAFALRPLAL